MTWPIDKLGLINQQLAIAGDNLVAVADDGSDEWTACSAAYEAGLEFMLEAMDWKSITTVQALNKTGVAPADPLFDSAYAKPPECIHVIWVRLADLPVVYQVLNNQIVLNNSGSQVVTAKFTSSSTGTTQLLRTFMTALGKFVQSGIYRGLHEDLGEARNCENEARLLIREAATRSDQEQPKRAMFNSRMAMARRVRRPWPPVPGGWGGSGNPGF